MSATKADYLVSIPSGREEEIAQIMREAGIDLDPRADRVYEMPEDSPWNGRIVGKFLTAVNRWLASRHLKPEIPPIEDIRAAGQAVPLMNFLNDEFTWEDGEVQGLPNFDDSSREGWWELVDSYPAIFNPMGTVLKGTLEVQPYQKAAVQAALDEIGAGITWE